MDDWAASPLARKLTAALARYTQWEKPLRSYRGRNMGRLNWGEFTWEEFDRGLRQLETSLRAEFDPRVELDPLFDELCGSYAAGDPERRAVIRTYAAQHPKLGGLLWRYANALTRRVQTATDQPLVERALAAVSIENCRSDMRDAQMTLADLWVAAAGAGIPPQPLFHAAGNWSADERTHGGCESTAALLRDFHASSVLRERQALGQPYGGPV